VNKDFNFALFFYQGPVVQKFDQISVNWLDQILRILKLDSFRKDSKIGSHNPILVLIWIKPSVCVAENFVVTQQTNLGSGNVSFSFLELSLKG